MNKKTFAFAEVKSAESDNINGEFEIIMSTDALDRDGESILKNAFAPLPASIPVHAFHDFNDPIGRAVPSYNEQGQLVGRGFFASTARAQEMRQLVADGVVAHSSVGFMAAERKSADNGTPEIHSAELLEVSFVSVPSNREAAVLMVKDANSTTLCAKCAQPTDSATPAPVSPADEAGKSAKTPASDAGKSPASNVVARYRLEAEHILDGLPV